MERTWEEARTLGALDCNLPIHTLLVPIQKETNTFMLKKTIIELKMPLKKKGTQIIDEVKLFYLIIKFNSMNYVLLFLKPFDEGIIPKGEMILYKISNDYKLIVYEIK